jgi:diguanylate cyclase (GGDEF)-like protein
MASILVADDLPLSRDLVLRILRDRGHRTSFASDGEEALQRFQRDEPDVVVLEMGLQRLSGVETCTRIKAIATGFVPVILVSTRGDLETRLAALAVAEDFLVKPYDVAELDARIGVQLRTRRLVEELRRGKPAGTEGAMPVDPGTGLRTTAFLVERLGEEWRRSVRFNEPMAVLLAAADVGGEAALAVVGTALKRILRQIDVVARGEGDVAAALLPNTHVAGALVAAERLKRELATGITSSGSGGLGAGVTASLGIACYPGRDIGAADDLLRLAGRALDRAREEGPGHICLYQHQGYLFRPTTV